MTTTNRDVFALIEEEFRKAEEQTTHEVGMLTVQRAHDTIREASCQPDPLPLWLSLWHMGEVCCLFADSNLGKSIYAMQIATHIAQTEKVVYYDFEQSSKQFQLRYTDTEGNLYPLPTNLYRAEINPDTAAGEAFEERIIADIEHAALQSDANILIIDNLTYLCAASEKGNAASQLMMRLMELKRKYALSILVIAHTPKRDLSAPITQNDLAGSKRLFNFFDSVFALGKSVQDENIRYIKQLKTRATDIEYGHQNVIECQIEKHGGLLQLVTTGYGEERNHLRKASDTSNNKMKEEAIELYQQGYSCRDIANLLNISKTTANKYTRKCV